MAEKIIQTAGRDALGAFAKYEEAIQTGVLNWDDEEMKKDKI